MTDLARALAVEAVAARELAAIPDWLWDGVTPPVPVEAISDSHYGLLIQEHDDLGSIVGTEVPGPVSGVLLPDLREVWVDASEAARAPGRRRFTIGHELGHWVLHCMREGAGRGTVVHCRRSEVREAAASELEQEEPRSGPRIVAGPDYPPEELDANQFAAALLMPRDLVVSEHQRCGGDARRLCDAFGVSAPAMERRLWFLSAV